MPRIERAAAEADIFVLNGDTFDFRWSTCGAADATTREAIAWLERTVRKWPECYFHFVLGNHDHVQIFIDELHELAERTPNLSWHPYHVKIGNSLFLHGDVANRRMTAADLADFRAQWLEEEARGEFANRVYDMAFRARMHCAVSRFAFPTNLVVERVQHYLDDIGEGQGSNTEMVFFGHTHNAIQDYERGGQRFYNGGAPMPGLDFNILKAEIAA